jgi:hypothetical protein
LKTENPSDKFRKALDRITLRAAPANAAGVAAQHSHHKRKHGCAEHRAKSINR